MQHSRSPALRIRQSPCRSFESGSVRAAPGSPARRERQPAAAFPGRPIPRQRCRPPASALRVTSLRRPSGLGNSRVAGDRGEARSTSAEGPATSATPRHCSAAPAHGSIGAVPERRPEGRRCRVLALDVGMAAERTWLAWWRTALVATAGALGVGRLAPRLLHAASAPYVVLGAATPCSRSPCSSSDPAAIGRLLGRLSAARPRRSPRPRSPFFTVGGVVLATVTTVASCSPRPSRPRAPLEPSRQPWAVVARDTSAALTAAAFPSYRDGREPPTVPSERPVLPRVIRRHPPRHDPEVWPSRSA